MTKTAGAPAAAVELGPPLLHARGVEKHYGGVTALRDGAVTIRRGEVVALAGENGSGKSTLAKIIAGVVRPDGGRVEFDGRPAEIRRPRHAIAAGVALVSQDPTAVPDMSVAENVMLGAGRRAWDIVRRTHVAKAALPHLRRVGIDVPPGTLVRSLPPGQRELVEIAKALVMSPRLLILDEATARFGEQQVQLLFKIVREEVASGMAVMLITHRLREITEVADRAFVLRDGALVSELSQGELSEERISSAMVGRERPARIAHGAKRGPVVLRVRDLEIGGKVPISLDVRAGEIVGLAGLAGSGRTELLEAVAGVSTAAAGVIEVDGTPMDAGLTPRDALAAGVTLVPEDRHRAGLVLGASIRHNIALGSWRWCRVVRAADENRLALDAVRRLGIKATSTGTLVQALSGGNQQKVVLGRCLAFRPRVLLLDDPTAGVDIGARDELYEVISELCRDGMAVLMASSELPELLRLADRICVLHERRLVGELDADDATEEQIVFLGGGGA